ncbi:BCCT family transporter [Jeotgalibacillus proteolyticus]|uniref:Glycine/betaine ABC transporter permease n=1 Tax=Jeotgalibacillus proteolyticus TaxID=2082395 RepID=A0A2S5G8V8_9BACL|nr:BCCT family transporter [Jeotgalibacillus proteolyticus]PPA69375.1 glycine/betaine ABC transporter permease [Jeotgalibacillus proteolyticus]
MKEKPEKASFTNTVFIVSAVIIGLFTIWGAFSPASLANYAGVVFNFTSNAFGWFYLFSVAIFVFFCLYLAFSKYGSIRLGKDNEKAEFSLFSWISMLFSAGFGVGIVFWGVAEPLTHFAVPPLEGVEPQSAEAARVAMRYSFFNWGIHQWSVFAIVGLALSYFQYRHKQKGLISETLESVMPKRGRSTLKVSVSILAVIATVIGVSTSVGMGIMQINGGLNYVFATPNNAWMQIAIVGIIMVLYLISSTTGINKGIKFLSLTNMLLVAILMVVFLISGPTVFILESFVLGIGDYVQNFVEMSFFLTPYTGDAWVHNWTVFYWAWVIAWSPFVGSFVARISKGRTIREFILGVMIVPPVIAFIWMAIFGGTGLYMDLFTGTAISEAVSQDTTTAVFVLLQEFPFYTLLSVIMIILIVIFLVTSADSAVFVLGMMSSDGSQNPSNTVKIIWGVLMAAITAVLIVSSGLQGLQTASLVSALPFTFILIFISVSLMKALNRDRQQKIENISSMQRKAQ